MQTALDGIFWYIQRLSAMTPVEVLHRGNEHLKRLAWRHDLRGWDAFDVSAGVVRPIPGLDEYARQAWPMGLTERVERAAADALKGRLSLLGVEWPWRDAGEGKSTEILWLQDPITGRDWPGAETYCFDIAYRRERSRGDIKFVWELNRLQFLPAVAFHAVRTADPAFGNWIWDTLASWMAANRPFRGPNWSSGIECGLRVVSVALAISVLGEPALTSERRLALRRFLAAHGYWLERYPSLYSSANNHRIAEALGLFMIGLVAPDIEGAAEWLHIGRTAIIEQARRQFADDGVGLEQSPTYVAFSAEMVALAFALGEALGQSLGADTRGRLVKVGMWLRMMMDEKGHVPRIGDDDETRVIALLPDREPRYVASIVAALAGVGQEPALAPPHRDTHLRDLVFRSPVGAGQLPTGVQSFPSGYTIVRDRIAGHAALLVLDHGPIGYLSIAAHGHADTLAIWLHIDGEPVLIDPGTYLYHSGGAWRDVLRDTAVHNTLLLDGIGSSIASGPFMWSHKACGELLEARAGPAWRITARHDGYVARFGVHHVRRVERHPEGFAVHDRLEGSGSPRPASLSYLFNPELVVSQENGKIMVRRGDAHLLDIAPPPGFGIEIIKGDADRKLGWYSRFFGVLEPAPQLILHGSMGQEATTVFQLDTSKNLAVSAGV